MSSECSQELATFFPRIAFPADVAASAIVVGFVVSSCNKSVAGDRVAGADSERLLRPV